MFYHSPMFGQHPIFDPEDVTDHLIQQEVAVEVAYHLVDFDDGLSFGAFREPDRLDVRIDHGPLAGPVAAHRVSSVLVATLHAIGPHDVPVHGGEDGFHIAGVKAVVNVLQELDFIQGSAPICRVMRTMHSSVFTDDSSQFALA